MTATSSLVSPISTGPRPLQLVDGNIPSPSATSPGAVLSPSRAAFRPPSTVGLSTPPPTASKFVVRNPRRQSSISYISSSNAPHAEGLRSPNSALTFGADSRPSVKRSNSLGVRSPKTAISESVTARTKGDRRSTGSVNDANRERSSPSSPAAERGALTLTEKHADLLHFIAQKESKCLELRSQLAVHEAELSQLKRKWERIVSRGMDRAYASPPMSSTTSSSPAPGGPSSLASSNGAMLGGIKEGVQGVGRLLAAGLDLSSPPPSSNLSPLVTSPAMQSSVATRPPIAPAVRKARHATTQSTSSVSTSATASTSTSASTARTAGTRLSQSSASSLEEHFGAASSNSGTVRGGCESISSPVELSPSLAKSLRRRSRDAQQFDWSSESTGSLRSPLSPSLDERPRAAKRASVGLAPASSIPGLNVQPVSSWMETVGSSVGKKWEELQKGQTFTKSQKRASLLLSDVSQSIYAALASPTPNSTLSPHSGKASPGPRSSSSVSVSSNPFGPVLSSMSTSPAPSAGSLLDEDEETGGKGLGEVLVPSVVGKEQAQAQGSSHGDDEEEWNW